MNKNKQINILYIFLKKTNKNKKAPIIFNYFGAFYIIFNLFQDL